jgi:hypothetical protein
MSFCEASGNCLIPSSGGGSLVPEIASKNGDEGEHEERVFSSNNRIHQRVTSLTNDDSFNY